MTCSLGRTRHFGRSNVTIFFTVANTVKGAQVCSSVVPKNDSTRSFNIVKMNGLYISGGLVHITQLLLVQWNLRPASLFEEGR